MGTTPVRRRSALELDYQDDKALEQAATPFGEDCCAPW